jgi:membrane protease YdiL (CAAX protease family)
MNTAAKRMQVWHAAIVLIWLVLPQFFAALLVWPLYLLVPLLGYALTVACVAPLRRSVNWLRLGRGGWDVAAATVVIIVLASTALVLWYVLYKPELSRITEVLRNRSYTFLILIGVVFSIFNALLEEILFRGILYEALDAEYGLWMAVVVQGVIFGIIHAQGFPNGVLGVVMASLYGVMLGWLRHFSGGMLWPFVAHIFADATIFLLLLFDMGYLPLGA